MDRDKAAGHGPGNRSSTSRPFAIRGGTRVNKLDGNHPETREKKTKKKLKQKHYEKELARLQVELSKLQEWVVDHGLKVVVIFEGRDAAGKGGTISRIIARLNPRVCRVAALAKPTDREQSQWYFQRYVAQLPSAGEIVLFDRSWYNRAGVDRVMGFCTEEEYREFLRSCPEFERMLVRSDIHVIKYWFSVSAKEQARRFKNRIKDPLKSWKFSDMDLQSYMKWDEYSHAKDEMMNYTDIKQAPWYVVPSDSKRRARLNCITHLLSLFPYDKDPPTSKIDLPDRDTDSGYVRPPMDDQRFIPEVY
ncbi:MAG: polyphosphate kinase 2 [Gemmatimonadetes bacterium]|nr:polyphosphate kinase 2 [Gemmatimonadota bacterium]MYG85915.1 polyphosphate kinase 2 [Gemmatimonadota bacterium]MYJ89268.1 polyphosphate kinase 2 [Gemmatimonadota bacterium]